jgi:hypothetical protein
MDAESRAKRNAIRDAHRDVHTNFCAVLDSYVDDGQADPDAVTIEARRALRDSYIRAAAVVDPDGDPGYAAAAVLDEPPC